MKLHRAANTARETMENIALGFAQMGSMGTVSPPSVFPARSDVQALHSDWEKIGADLTRSIEQARKIEKAK